MNAFEMACRSRGIKDIIETADMPTQTGSALFAGFRGERDAASVAALREAGGVRQVSSDPHWTIL